MLRGDLATRFGFGLRLAYRKRFGLPAKASIWCGVPGETCVSNRFRTSRRRQWRLRREQDLTEAEAYVRHARIPVNGNLFGNISTHRRYSTARDPYFA